MGLFGKLFGKEEAPAPAAPAVETVPGALYAPITGNYIPLSDIPDEVFSSGVLGPGCGIEPEGESVVAPCNGTISTVIDSKHAVGITSDEGAELLIHVGIDTVKMNGDGFSVSVKPGDKVSCGQTLITFSLEKIKAAGYPTTTAFIVANADDAGQPAIETGKRFEQTEKIGQLGE